MLFRILVLITSFSLFAQSTTVGALGGANAIFPIDASTRGLDIINLFKSLFGKTVPSGTVYEIGIQTKYNGFLPWVTSVTGTTNNTLLIIQNGLTQVAAVPQSTAPLIIPTEQVVEMVFTIHTVKLPAPNTSPSPPIYPFSATNPPGILPIYSIIPTQRAADILYVFAQYLSTYKKVTNVSQYMSIQTTLLGLIPPYDNANAPSFNGRLPYVQTVTLTPSPTIGPFLQITYNQFRNDNTLITIEVAPEQISGITFSAT